MCHPCLQSAILHIEKAFVFCKMHHYYYAENKSHYGPEPKISVGSRGIIGVKASKGEDPGAERCCCGQKLDETPTEEPHIVLVINHQCSGSGRHWSESGWKTRP